jgi:hypothetical protein
VCTLLLPLASAGSSSSSSFCSRSAAFAAAYFICIARLRSHLFLASLLVLLPPKTNATKYSMVALKLVDFFHHVKSAFVKAFLMALKKNSRNEPRQKIIFALFAKNVYLHGLAIS